MVRGQFDLLSKIGCKGTKKNAYKQIYMHFFRIYVRFLLKELAYFLIKNNFFVEDVSTGFGTLHHLNAFGMSTTGVGSMQGCNRFLCHSLVLSLIDYLISL